MLFKYISFYIEINLSNKYNIKRDKINTKEK